MDVRLSADERADMVLKQMTLDEKIDLVHGQGMPGWGNAEAECLPGQWRGRFCAGRAAAGHSVHPDERCRVWRTDERGKRPLFDGAAFQSCLGRELGPTGSMRIRRLIGRELRAQGYNMTLGGGVNLTREPRNGRTFEYMGEDPILAGTLVGNRSSASRHST